MHVYVCMYIRGCTYFSIKRFDKVSATKDKSVQFLCLTSSCCNDPPVTGPDGRFCRWNMCMSDIAVLLRVCRHISHVGWNAETGFDVSSFRFIPSQLCKFEMFAADCCILTVMRCMI